MIDTVLLPTIHLPAITIGGLYLHTITSQMHWLFILLLAIQNGTLYQFNSLLLKMTIQNEWVFPVKPWIFPILLCELEFTPRLIRYSTMENHHFYWENHHFDWENHHFPTILLGKSPFYWGNHHFTGKISILLGKSPNFYWGNWRFRLGHLQ